MKHTPGPWIHSEQSAFIWDATGNHIIADTDTGKSRVPEFMKNAQFISASPELYDACAMADYCLDPRNQEIVTEEDRRRALKAIRDAMRKAGRA